MTAPSHPTPADMPGANTNPQLAQPISTAPPAPPAAAPEATPAAAPAAPTPAAPPATDKPAEDTDWRAHARTWEQRAKENADKAKKFDEAEDAKKTQDERDRDAQIAQAKRIADLEEEIARERVARETGVLPELLAGSNYDEMSARAKQLLDWRGTGQAAPPPPQTAAVPAATVTAADTMGSSPNGVRQLTKEEFVALPPAERMVAVRAGQCVNIGVGKPPQQRRMGNQLELGATAGQVRASM